MNKLFVIFGLVLMLVIAGCVTDAEKTAKKKKSVGKEPPSGEKQPPKPQCTVDNDCKKSGLVCEDGRCVAPPECKENADCKKEGLFCIDNKCQFRSCKTDEGCQREGYICESNVCKRAECSQNTDCKKTNYCEKGRCTFPPACEDDDPGNLPDKKGTVTFPNGKKYSDTCADENTIKEYNCENGKVVSVDEFCNNLLPGSACKNGACIGPEAPAAPQCKVDADCAAGAKPGVFLICKEEKCVLASPCSDDTDSENDRTKKGSLLVNGKTYYDECSTNTRVVEYYCSNNQIASKGLTCAEGFTCSDGACVKIEPQPVVQPEPAVEPEPAPAPAPQPQPEPEIVYVPVPTPTPQPVPTPTPQPTPQPTPAPVEKPPELPGKGKITIQFNKGWNLFSLSFKDPTISTTCDGFDSAKARWYYDTENKEFTHPLSLEEGKGYWFKSSKDCKLIVEGDAYKLKELTLGSGWNQIGSGSEIVDFDSLLGSCEVTHGPWDYNAEKDKYTKADKNVPGQGYFVKVGSECKLE